MTLPLTQLNKPYNTLVNLHVSRSDTIKGIDSNLTAEQCLLSIASLTKLVIN